MVEVLVVIVGVVVMVSVVLLLLWTTLKFIRCLCGNWQLQ